MPNRMLRPWLTSERMDSLSQGAEIFFTRLIMVADDNGTYHGNPRLLRSALFPLKTYTDIKVAEWLAECVTAKVLFKYVIDGRCYIRIDDFRQRLQNKRSLFPEPPVGFVDSQKVTVSHGESPPELEEKRREVEPELELELPTASVTVEVWPTFDDWWNLFDKKSDKPKCEKLWKKIEQGVREKIMLHTEDYVKATPDKQYRKNATTYLNGQCWNDEIILRNGKQQTNNQIHPASQLAEDFAKRVSAQSAGPTV